MKTKSLILGVSAAGALLSTPAVMAQSAVSDPVGYLTVKVAPASAAAPSLSLVAPTLLSAPSFTGAVTAVNGTEITVSGALTAGQFSTGGVFYAEVTGGAGTIGAFADIASNAVGTITLAEDLGADLVVGSMITVRQHATLNSFLGADNAAGLQAGNNIGEADNVTIIDSTTGGSATYFFVAGAGWVDSGFMPAGDTIVGPEQGLIVLRRAAVAADFTSVGHVKTNASSLPILKGLNVIGVPNAVGTTLDSSALGDAVAPGNNIGEADNVTVFTGGTAQTFFFVDGAGWVDSGFVPAGATPLEEGSSVLVLHRPDAAATWAAPAPVIN